MDFAKLCEAVDGGAFNFIDIIKTIANPKYDSVDDTNKMEEDYGHEGDEYGVEAVNAQLNAAAPADQPASAAMNKSAILMKGSSSASQQEADSDVDEDEIRDNFEEEPPVITVQFEIKILCAKEILLRDGTQLKVQCIRGEQKAQTNIKMLKSSTVYFQQKVVMKTTLEKAPGKAKYGKKDLQLKLIRVEGG